jgi:L-ascorbate metabolism protein UlaG (beta-lactamase superfamily)
MMDVRITHIGGPTALIEVGGWRLLTDPRSTPRPEVRLRLGDVVAEARGPVGSPDELPAIDAVLRHA